MISESNIGIAATATFLIINGAILIDAFQPKAKESTVLYDCDGLLAQCRAEFVGNVLEFWRSDEQDCGTYSAITFDCCYAYWIMDRELTDCIVGKLDALLRKDLKKLSPDKDEAEIVRGINAIFACGCGLV